MPYLDARPDGYVRGARVCGACEDPPMDPEKAEPPPEALQFPRPEIITSQHELTASDIFIRMSEQTTLTIHVYKYVSTGFVDLTITEPNFGAASVDILNKTVLFDRSYETAAIDDFTYTVTDDQGRTATANISVDVLPSASIPQTIPVDLIVLEDGVLVFSLESHVSDETTPYDQLVFEFSDPDNGTINILTGPDPVS